MSRRRIRSDEYRLRRLIRRALNWKMREGPIRNDEEGRALIAETISVAIDQYLRPRFTITVSDDGAKITVS